MTTKVKTTSIKWYVTQFEKNLTIVKVSLAKAAALYVEALDKYGTAAQVEFRKRYPSVRTCTWATLQHIGRGDLAAGAVLYSDTMKGKLLTMPIEDQNKIITSGKGINVLGKDGQIKFVRFENLTPADAKVVFDGAKIRTRQEQRDYIASHMEDVVPYVRLPYHTDGNKLVVCRKCSIGLAELEHIVKSMKAKAGKPGRGKKEAKHGKN